MFYYHVYVKCPHWLMLDISRKLPWRLSSKKCSGLEIKSIKVTGRKGQVPLVWPFVLRGKEEWWIQEGEGREREQDDKNHLGVWLMLATTVLKKLRQETYNELKHSLSCTERACFKKQKQNNKQKRQNKNKAQIIIIYFLNSVFSSTIWFL